jgi:hypothetical protein
MKELHELEYARESVFGAFEVVTSLLSVRTQCLGKLPLPTLNIGSPREEILARDRLVGRKVASTLPSREPPPYDALHERTKRVDRHREPTALCQGVANLLNVVAVAPELPNRI